MNLLLYVTIIVLLILFTYSFLISINEPFLNFPYSRLDNLYHIENTKNNTYDQMNEFIPDTYNYTIFKDSGLMLDTDSELNLNSIEYQNLKKKLDFYKNLEKELDEDNQLQIKLKLIEQQTVKRINYPLVQKEISLLRMDYIMSEIKKKHKLPKNIKLNINTLESTSKLTAGYGFKLIKNWLLEEISVLSDTKSMRIKLVDTKRFKFKHEKIIDYYRNYEKGFERVKFQAVLYRDNKQHNFFVYFDVILDNKNINYYCRDIVIIGISNLQYLLFAKYMDKYYKLDNNGVHLSLSNKNPTIVKDEYVTNYRKIVDDYLNNIMVQKEKQELEENEQRDGYCFFKKAQTKDECISYEEKNGQGIWDKPCQYDEECPFYKRNSNYPNKRGGCIDGFCELPINIQNLSYREYDDSNLNAALCYNCDKIDGCVGVECNMCCEEQKDRNLYPELNGPDYAFENDYNERLNHKDSFYSKNVSPISIVL